MKLWLQSSRLEFRVASTANEGQAPARTEKATPRIMCPRGTCQRWRFALPIHITIHWEGGCATHISSLIPLLH